MIIFVDVAFSFWISHTSNAFIFDVAEIPFSREKYIALKCV